MAEGFSAVSLRHHELDQSSQTLPTLPAPAAAAIGPIPASAMNLSRLPKNLVILVAEADIWERKRLEAISPELSVTLKIVNDGEEASNYLSGHAPYFTRELYPFPDLLICNLKMPRMNGFDLLNWISRDSDCSSMPRVIVDDVQDPSDLRRAYQLGANTIFSRPNSIEDLRRTMRVITNYWNKAELPFVRHC